MAYIETKVGIKVLDGDKGFIIESPCVVEHH